MGFDEFGMKNNYCINYTHLAINPITIFKFFSSEAYF